MMFLLIGALTSMLLAAIMSVVAWRMSGDETRRSAARVAALAADIHDESRVPLEPACNRDDPALSLFAAPQQARPAGRPIAVLAGGALVFGAAVGIALLSSGRFPRVTHAGHADVVAAPAARPLELVALGHERVGDQLTVRGVVRNPASGAGLERLTAVVLLFTPDGGYVATGRAVVETPALRPGGESTFAVTVPRATEAGRYRVSFRTEEHVVPHLDRRHEG